MSLRKIYSLVVAFLLAVIVSISNVNADESETSQNSSNNEAPPPQLTPTPTSTPHSSTVPADSSSFVLLGGLLDDFNRANGGIGSDWSGDTANYAIAANQLDVGNSTTSQGIYWNDPSFSAEQEVYVTLSTMDTNADEIGLILKAQSNTNWGTGLLNVVYFPGSNVVQVWTYNGSAWTQRGSNIAVTFTDGDQFGAQATAAGEVGIFKNGSIIGIVDITAWPLFASTGYIGLLHVGAGGLILDDFGGGDATVSLPTPTPTPIPCTDPLTCNPVTSIPAYWRCNIPSCAGAPWMASAISWPLHSAYESNARTGSNSRMSFSISDNNVIYPYMQDWADGCEITAVSGTVLIIEWQRGTDVWEEFILNPGDSHTIDLTSVTPPATLPQDNALIEALEGTTAPFSVSLNNCTPPGAPLMMGETDVPPNTAPTSSGNANTLFAQQTTLSNGGNIESISLFVYEIAGQVRLGIYDDNSGSPGDLVAETAAFTAGPGWNTQNTLTNPLLAAGTYWLAFIPDNNTMEVAVEAGAGVSRSVSNAFGPLPGTFPGSPTNLTSNFSIYATLQGPTAISLNNLTAQQTSLFIMIIPLLISLGLSTTLVITTYKKKRQTSQ
ncbi:MAG: hypothetical protein H6658_14465 [Ardenticatenaceae bacterium]|nr:hypothetical protein [Ardenticatenaceae bacterium]